MKSVYKKVRAVLSDKNKGRLSKLVFLISNKPKIKTNDSNIKKKFPHGEKGGLIFTADFELSWAWRFTKTKADFIKKGRIARDNFPKIIEILDKYSIPITFATVGHLFLEKCNKGEHDWMKRIPHFDDHWKFMEGDWFQHDPYSDYKSSPEWYAPDLIRMIMNAKTKHEISTHTFTHIDFSDKNCPPEVADDEIKACIDAAKPYGIELNSIVFPGGTWGNIETLKNNGIKIYRNNEEFDMAYPYYDNIGILVSPTTAPMEFNREYGWSINYYFKRIKKYLDKAVETNTVAHLWFHPSLDSVFLEELFPKVFEYANELRSNGDLWIGTLEDIAKHINSQNSNDI